MRRRIVNPVQLITQTHEAAKESTNSCPKGICPCWSSLNISLESMYQPIFTLALAILYLDQNMTQFACLPSVQLSSDLPSSSFLPSNKFCAHKFSLGCLRRRRRWHSCLRFHTTFSWIWERFCLTRHTVLVQVFHRLQAWRVIVSLSVTWKHNIHNR